MNIYMSTIALNLPLNASFKLNLSLRFFRTLSLISIISLLIVYIFQVTALARDRYNLEAGRRKLADLIEEKGTLEINFSKVQSMANLDAYLLSRDFEKEAKTKYIQIYLPLVKNDGGR